MKHRLWDHPWRVTVDSSSFAPHLAPNYGDTPAGGLVERLQRHPERCRDDPRRGSRRGIVSVEVPAFD
jgi:hypothetical protein